MEAEIPLAPRARLADVLAKRTWRGNEGEEEKRGHMAEGGWRREVPEKRAREEEDVAAMGSGL